MSTSLYSEVSIHDDKMEEKADSAALEVAGIPYAVKYKGKIPSEILEKFEEISLLKKLKESLPSSITGLGKRADQDKKKFRKILYSKGFFAAKLSFRISLKEERAVVKFKIEPGKRYRIGEINVKSKDNPLIFKDVASLLIQDIVNIAHGEEVDFDKALGGMKLLKKYFHHNGYPHVDISEPVGVVDHENSKLNLTYLVHTGILSRIKDTKILGLKTVDESFVRNRLSWRSGDIYDSSKIEKTKGILGQTQLISSLIVKLDPLDFRDCILDKNKKPIPQDVLFKTYLKETLPRAIGAGLRYSITEKVGGHLFWHHNNFTGIHDHFGFSLKYFKDYKRLKFEYDLLDFYQPLQTLKTKAVFLRESDPLKYSGSIQYLQFLLKRPYSKIYMYDMNFDFGISVLFENASLEQTGFYEKSYNFKDKHKIVGFPLTLDMRELNNKKDPSSGYSFKALLTPYFGKMVDVKNTNRLLLSCSYYIPFSISTLGEPLFVMALRGRFGKLFVPNKVVPPLNKRFFAGGASSVRAYGLGRLSPYGVTESNKDVLFMGGRSLSEFTVEFRYRFNDDWGGVLFADAGLVTNPFSTSKMIDESAFSAEELEKRTIKKDRFLWGPGIGIRYFTSFGPIRVDLAFPMKVRKVSNEKKTRIDSKYQIYISINQDF